MMTDSYYDVVNFCVYYRGFIYITFYHGDSQTLKIDTRFHVFDTIKDEWKVSPTTLKTEASHVIAALAP